MVLKSHEPPSTPCLTAAPPYVASRSWHGTGLGRSAKNFLQGLQWAGFRLQGFPLNPKLIPIEQGKREREREMQSRDRAKERARDRGKREREREPERGDKRYAIQKLRIIYVQITNMYIYIYMYIHIYVYIYIYICVCVCVCVCEYAWNASRGVAQTWWSPKSLCFAARGWGPGGLNFTARR